MNYKFLIFGRNINLAGDIIKHASDDCTCLSTSDIYMDIVMHIKLMQPDAYIIFISEDDDKNQILNQIRKITDDEICKEMVFVIVAEAKEMEKIDAQAPLLKALKITRPTSAMAVENQTKAYIHAMEKLRKEEEEKLLQMEAAAKARRAARRAQAEQRMQESGGGTGSGYSIFGSSDEEESPFKAALRASARFAEADANSAPNIPVPEPEFEPSKLVMLENTNSRKHILVVDDDRNVLKLLKTTLSEKYDVTTMLNGKMAEKFLETKTADLILLDHEMPVESGLEVFQKIKQNINQAQVPVVFLTGTSDTAKIREILALQPRGYLLKPVDVDKLMNAIAEILS